MAIVRAAAYTARWPMRDSALDLATGLTVTATVRKDSGAAVASTNAVVETGGGMYSLDLTADEMTADCVTVVASAAGALTQSVMLLTDADVMGRLGTPAGGTVASAIAGVQVDVADVSDAVADVKTIADAVKLKTDTIGATAFTITNPVAQDLTVTVTEGDDYDATHGLQITIPVADSTHLLGLDDVAAVVKLIAGQADWTASAVTETAEGYDVTFEPTAAETALLTIARQSYQLKATLADGDVVTPVEGDLVTRASLA